MARAIAFFGGTGGCANACLARCLRDEVSSVALVRAPEKLYAKLEARGVPGDKVHRYLNVVEGDIRNLEDVKKTLFNEGKGVGLVISGIGGTPMLQFDIFKPLVLAEGNVCADASRNIITALSETTKPFAQTPLFAFISANGVLDDAPRDYPLLLMPLYRWLLRGVYDDKRMMESELAKCSPAIRHVIVRPSVLMDAPAQGLQRVRQGTREAPVLGYSISRDDVGLWLYEKLIKLPEEVTSFKAESFCITY